MKRVTLLLAALLVLVGAAPAHADEIDGGALVPGVYKDVSIPFTMPDVRVAFPVARAGDLTLDVRDSDYGEQLDLFVYDPAGALNTSCTYIRNLFCRVHAGVAGTWHVVLRPRSGINGHLGLAVAADQNNGVLHDGQTVNGVVHYQAQRMRWTFTGVDLDWYTLTVNRSAWVPDWAARTTISSTTGVSCDAVVGTVCYIPVHAASTFYLWVTPDQRYGATGSVDFTWRKLHFDSPAEARAFTPSR